MPGAGGSPNLGWLKTLQAGVQAAQDDATQALDDAAAATAIKTAAGLESVTSADAARRYMVTDRDNGVFQYASDGHTFGTDQYTAVDRFGLDYLTAAGVLLKRTGIQVVTPQMFGAVGYATEALADSGSDQADAVQRFFDFLSLVPTVGGDLLQGYIPEGYYRIERTIISSGPIATFLADGWLWVPYSLRITGFFIRPGQAKNISESSIKVRKGRSGIYPAWHSYGDEDPDHLVFDPDNLDHHDFWGMERDCGVTIGGGWQYSLKIISECFRISVRARVDTEMRTGVDQVEDGLSTWGIQHCNYNIQSSWNSQVNLQTVGRGRADFNKFVWINTNKFTLRGNYGVSPLGAVNRPRYILQTLAAAHVIRLTGNVNWTKGSILTGASSGATATVIGPMLDPSDPAVEYKDKWRVTDLDFAFVDGAKGPGNCAFWDGETVTSSADVDDGTTDSVAMAFTDVINVKDTSFPYEDMPTFSFNDDVFDISTEVGGFKGTGEAVGVLLGIGSGMYFTACRMENLADQYCFKIGAACVDTYLDGFDLGPGKFYNRGGRADITRRGTNGGVKVIEPISFSWSARTAVASGSNLVDLRDPYFAAYKLDGSIGGPVETIGDGWGHFGSMDYRDGVLEPGIIFDRDGSQAGRQFLGIKLKVEKIKPYASVTLEMECNGGGTSRASVAAFDSAGANIDGGLGYADYASAYVRSGGHRLGSGSLVKAHNGGMIRYYTSNVNSTSKAFYFIGDGDLDNSLDLTYLIIICHPGTVDYGLKNVRVTLHDIDAFPVKDWVDPVYAIPQRGYTHAGTQLYTANTLNICTASGWNVLKTWSKPDTINRAEWVISTSGGRIYEANSVTSPIWDGVISSGDTEPVGTTVGAYELIGTINWKCVSAGGATEAVWKSVAVA